MASIQTLLGGERSVDTEWVSESTSINRIGVAALITPVVIRNEGSRKRFGGLVDGEAIRTAADLGSITCTHHVTATICSNRKAVIDGVVTKALCRVFETSKDVSGVVTVIDAGFNGHCIGVEAPSGESAAGTISITV
jgi:hypothetical protein